jgi:hypothetical protein
MPREQEALVKPLLETEASSTPLTASETPVRHPLGKIRDSQRYSQKASGVTPASPTVERNHAPTRKTRLGWAPELTLATPTLSGGK